jgi:hypothetical protein
MQRWWVAAAAALAVAGSINLGWAQNTNATNTFDTEISITSFVNNWWGIGPTITWDPMLDAGNDPFSGSVRYEVPFTPAGGEQFMTHFTIANRWRWDNGYTLDATTYTHLSFDIKVDPASRPITGGANYGNLQVGLTTRTSWDNRISTPSYTIPLTATQWTQVNIPVDPTWNFLHEVVGFFIYMWSGDAHTDMLIFNLDNVMLTKPSAPVVIPPPTVSLEPATSGLNLVASTDVQYARRSIRTADTGFSWIGSAEPVTYELTIKQAPGDDALATQAHLFLVPALPNDDAPSIDWNAAHLVWLHIENLANGAGQATFRYKTNQPSGNSMLFNTDPTAAVGVGNLGTLPSATVLGTWKLTIANDTDITMIAPDGATASVNLTPEAAGLFAGEMRVYYGMQANNATHYGKRYVLNRVKVSKPSGVLVEDDFSGATLDTAKWEVRSADAANAIAVVPASAPWWLTWTLPAVGFSPQIASRLAPDAAWKAPLSEQQSQVMGTRRVVLQAAELDAGANFFRMIKREFVKLQILMPGEVPAPGTPTGKTGTPTPQAALEPFNVTIRAVSEDWYPIGNITDTVSLTSTDDFVQFVPASVALVNGLGTVEVWFGSSGTHTITVTDETDAAKRPNTSSPTVVN